jgi:hypothetical protein
VRLSDTELSFYLAVAKRLPPLERPRFLERVTALLEGHPDPGPGTVNAVIKAGADRVAVCAVAPGGDGVEVVALRSSRDVGPW